jgi:hypothetical protein
MKITALKRTDNLLRNFIHPSQKESLKNTPFLCLWISNVVVFFVFNELRWGVIVDIGGIDDHHCSNIILKDISGLLKRQKYPLQQCK